MSKGMCVATILCLALTVTSALDLSGLERICSPTPLPAENEAKLDECINLISADARLVADECFLQAYGTKFTISSRLLWCKDNGSAYFECANERHASLSAEEMATLLQQSDDMVECIKSNLP